jgi:hypothetical protein
MQIGICKREEKANTHRPRVNIKREGGIARYQEKRTHPHT